jgi:RNase P subunit RPR2
LSGYDTRIKRFALLSNNEGDQRVQVHIHRAYCRNCGRILVPEEPFYPGTRVGAPVVDLCCALAETIPYSRVSTRLAQMGVQVDRWSVRSYVRNQTAPTPTIAVFGMKIPVSIIALSALSGSARAAGRPEGEDVLAACNFPFRTRPVR